jgi:hypothetical protein
MAEAVANEELEKGLKQARKKPRNFLLVGTGSKPLKLVVQKKPIKPPEIVEAKKEVKGTIAITGVCQGEGAKMTFFVTEECAFKTVALKDLIGEETGLTLKPEFQVVPALPEVKEDDDESEDASAGVPPATAAAAQPASAAPPVAPPAPGPTAAQLTAALNKLTPAIQAAVAANPAKKAEILKPVADFQAKVKANELDAAKELLVTINRAVSAAGSAAAGPAAPPPPKADAAAAAKPPVAPPPDAGAKPPLEQADLKAQQTFEKLLDGISDRYVQVLRGQPSTASQLRGVMDFANGKAEQNDFTSAVSALQRLPGLLDKAEEEIEQRIADAFVDEEDEQRGVVAFRKALLLWSSARDAVRNSVDRLQQAVSAVDPDARFHKIEGILETYNERLDDALIDCINADNAEDRKFYHERARDLIADYESMLASDAAVLKIDDNPFVPTAIGKTLTRALKQVAAELK